MYLPKDSSKTSRWIRAFYDVCTVSELRKPHSHVKRPALAIQTSRHVTEARILVPKHRATLLLQFLPYVVLSWTVYTHGMSRLCPSEARSPGLHSMHGWAAWLKLLGFHWQHGVTIPGCWDFRMLLVSVLLFEISVDDWSFRAFYNQTIHRSATIPWISLIHQWKFLHQELRRASLSIDQEQPNQGHIPKHCVETIVLIWHCFDLASWESGLQTHGVLDEKGWSCIRIQVEITSHPCCTSSAQVFVLHATRGFLPSTPRVEAVVGFVLMVAVARVSQVAVVLVVELLKHPPGQSFPGFPHQTSLAHGHDGHGSWIPWTKSPEGFGTMFWTEKSNCEGLVRTFSASWRDPSKTNFISMRVQ